MIAEKKKPKSDPIKTIGLNVTPLAREIVIQIANALGLKIRYDRDEEGNIIGVSTYAGNCLRLSDHSTYMQTWVDAGTWKAPYRYDIVIEDDATFAKQQVQEGYDFSITEYVAKAENMDVEKAKMIAYDIRNCINTGIYANNIGAEKRMLNSNHETDESLIQHPMSVNSNKEANQPQITDNKTNKNMKKNTIKLNESQLKKIVAESVKRVLKEDIMTNNDLTDYHDKYMQYYKMYLNEKGDRGAANMMEWLRRLFEWKDNDKDAAYAAVVDVLEGKA